MLFLVLVLVLVSKSNDLKCLANLFKCFHQYKSLLCLPFLGALHSYWPSLCPETQTPSSLGAFVPAIPSDGNILPDSEWRDCLLI